MKKIIFTMVMGMGLVFSSNGQALKVAADGNVGVGNGTPTEKLDVAGNVLVTNNNYFMAKRADGSKHQMLGLDGFNTLVFNRSAIVNNKPSSLLFGIGQSGVFDMRNHNNQPVLRLIEANGRVGIGTISPDQLLTVNGEASKPGGGSWLTFSDRRLKNNVRDFNYGLDEVLKINPVFFKYSGELGLPSNKEYVGIIAQDMEKIAPFMISHANITDSTGNNIKSFLSYDASALPYMLVNSIKEQELKINNQEKQILELQKQLDIVLALVEELNTIKHNLNLENSELPKIGQNIPNPFTSDTAIEYFVPSSSESAQIRIFDQLGRQIDIIPIKSKGLGKISIEAHDFPNGTYFYEFIVDGKSVRTNKMIISK